MKQIKTTSLWMLAAIVGCTMVMTVLTSCSTNTDNPAPGGDKKIVGNWYANVSGKTYAKWNYGDTWQNTVFNDDDTGYTRIYYTYWDDAIGCEKIDFTYTASDDGRPRYRERVPFRTCQ